MGTEAEAEDRQKKEDTASRASGPLFNEDSNVTGLIKERIEFINKILFPDHYFG